MNDLIQTLARELDAAPEHVENVVRLIDEGATIPFIARYRKELHGSMDDQLLRRLMKAKKVLLEKGIDVRVVSMPCQEFFDQQDEQYKEAVLPNAMRKRLSVEMASSFGWHKYVGLDGITMSIDEFGKSAPAQDVIQSYGFTVDGVVENIEKLLK